MGKKSCAVFGCYSNYGDTKKYKTVFSFLFIPDPQESIPHHLSLNVQPGDTPKIIKSKRLTKAFAAYWEIDVSN